MNRRRFNRTLKTVLTLMTLLSAAATAATAPHWQAVPQHGDVPPPLYEAGISFSFASGAQDTVYRFGGDNDEELVNDFYSLDLNTFTWKNLGSPQTPVGRANTLLIPGPCINCVSIVGGRGEFRTSVMYPEMQTYHIKTGRWVKVSRAELGQRFAVKRAAALVVGVPDAHHPNQPTFYAFGGVGNTVPRFPTTPTGLHNDIAVYDPETGWHVVKTSGQKPAPRAWTTGAYDPATHSLLVFGGYRLGPDQGPNTPGSDLFGPTNFDNDLWSLNLDNFTWTELHPQGPIPAPRDNATAFFDTAHGWLVLFGGERFDSSITDLWYYSVADNRWTEVDLGPGALVPPGRVGSVSFLRETPGAYELYLHSGITSEDGGVLLNDLWKLTWPKD
ncbi:MAG TPA: kelch repeat-containing protein [Thermoanaerobaculia bacterium]|nr:kelch repeat-containing protein [Thermoanaerobaculia bacterium]